MNKKKRIESFKKIEELLKARNVSAYQVSKDIGISRTVFTDWKAGRSMPKTDKLLKIANYFGVTVDYFLNL